MYRLTSLNLTGLGGPMGSERVSVNFRRYFKSRRAAKAAAERDYGGKLEWLEDGTTGDLGHVEYGIERVVVEE